MQQLDHKAIWLFFLSSIFRFLILVIVVGGYISFMFLDPGVSGEISLERVFLPIVGILIVSLILAWIWAELTYRFYKYELREDGFRKEHGIIWKKYVTVPYDRIQNVDIYRGIIARLLGLSDLQIQTAGGITAGSYGAFSEGRLPGLAHEVAEQLRDELVRRARSSRSQGL